MGLYIFQQELVFDKNISFLWSLQQPKQILSPKIFIEFNYLIHLRPEVWDIASLLVFISQSSSHLNFEGHA